MSPQTQDAIRRMKLAGFERNEFTARTETRRIRYGCYEYGDAKIRLTYQGKNKGFKNRKQLIENGFNVSIFLTRIRGCRLYTTVLVKESHNENGKLTVHDLRV